MTSEAGTSVSARVKSSVSGTRSAESRLPVTRKEKTAYMAEDMELAASMR